MNNKTSAQWLKDKPVIIKGIAVGISQVEARTLKMRDMAYGVVASLLEYEGVEDEMYHKIFDIVSEMETITDGQENLLKQDFEELKKLVS